MNENPYREDWEQASEYLRLTIALLANHKIPSSPFNYRMGYDSIAGTNNILTKALDEISAQPGRPISEYLWAVYQRSYIDNGQSLHAIREELKNIVASLQKDIACSGEKLSGYVERLNDFSAILNGSSSPHTMMTEVKKVIEATRETEDSQQHFGTLIAQLSDELDSLRRDLAQAREESMKDPLTGISNRKSFDIALQEAIVSAGRGEADFSVLIADIDNFKQVNDRYGHLIGDKVLRFVASTLKRCVKGKDVVARFGGEEFAVILINTDSDDAFTVAEQIRQAVFSGIIKDMTSQRILDKTSVSIGVAQFDADDLAVNVLQRADAALYLAKERGRNRVEKR